MDMGKDMEEMKYECGPFKYNLPGHACVFCKHCSDVFWDYSHGIYGLFCDKDNLAHASLNGTLTGHINNGNLSGKCTDFEENNDEAIH